MPRLRTWIVAVGLFVSVVPSARAQGVAFLPGIGSFPNGAMMSATPAVSFDRRYVRLSVNPQFSEIEGFDNYSVPAAVGGGGIGGGGVGGVMGFAGLNGPVMGPAGQVPSSRLEGPSSVAGLADSPAGDFEDRPWPRGAVAAEPRQRTEPAPRKPARRRGRAARVERPTAGVEVAPRGRRTR